MGEWVCGVDEAGRGPVLGPLVVGAVAVEDQAPLRRLGVKDSKRLPAARREALAVALRSAVRHHLVVIPAEVLDRVRGDRNLNLLEAEAFADAISALDPHRAFVDAADVVEGRFAARVASRLRHPIPVVARHHADEAIPVVSAASILAKVARDAAIQDIEGELGEPIGSGYCHDPVTVAFLHRWVKAHGSPPPHCRTSWETTRRLIGQLSLRSLADFGGA